MTYQPISRRPIAEIFRGTARGATRFCVRAGISADAISYASMVAATAAAFCFWQSSRYSVLLLLAPLLCDLRLWCNMLDGMVALAAGQASARGEVLNDLPDRFSDVVIFVGVAHSFAGPMSKPWRMVALQAGAWLSFGGVRVALEWACLLIIAGCALTIGRRLRRTFRALEQT